MGPMEVETAVDSSSDMILKVLRKTCSRAAARLAPSMADRLKCNEPNTMAAVTATNAVASRISTSVKASSESSRGRKHIRARLQHFIGRSLLPENLDFHFSNSRQSRRGDDALPPVPFRPICDVAGDLIARRRIAKVAGGFSDRVHRTELRFDQFFLRQHGGGRDVCRAGMKIEIPIPQSEKDRQGEGKNRHGDQHFHQGKAASVSYRHTPDVLPTLHHRAHRCREIRFITSSRLPAILAAVPA